jgi:hypothetical protein
MGKHRQEKKDTIYQDNTKCDTRRFKKRSREGFLVGKAEEIREIIGGNEWSNIIGGNESIQKRRSMSSIGAKNRKRRGPWQEGKTKNSSLPT